jgi:hypothetical protein
VILIDRVFIQGKLKSQDEGKLKSRLLLHETGHIVLHWSDIQGRWPEVYPQQSSAPPVDPEHEQQAWWFAMVTVALAVGAAGKASRLGPPKGHDEAWLVA